MGQNTTCPTSCYNITEPDQHSTKPTIFDDLPVSVSGMAGAVEYYVDQLRRRLAAHYTMMSPAEQQFDIELRRRVAGGSRVDQVTWRLSNAQGAYPLLVDYTTSNDSQSDVRFEHVQHAIDWLVQRLA